MRDAACAMRPGVHDHERCRLAGSRGGLRRLDRGGLGVARARDPPSSPPAIHWRGEARMTPTVGIFFDRASAERAVNNLRAVGLSPKSIHVLVPGSEPLVAKVATSEAEQPGMGKAIGGARAGAARAASCAELGAAAAAGAVLPVAGPAHAVRIVRAPLPSPGGAGLPGARGNARGRRP